VVDVPVTLTVRIPKGTASAPDARSPRYISSAIQSIVFRLTAVVPAGGGTYTGALPTNTIVPIAYASVNCTADADGDKLCTATSTAPAPATDVWAISTYAVASPTVGTTVPLSIYTGFSHAISVAGPNVLAVATWGVPATLAFSPAVGIGMLGTPATFTTSLQAKDASGATLVGGENFSDAAGTVGAVTFGGCGANVTPTPASITAANPSALGGGGLSIAWNGTGSTLTPILCDATGPGDVAAHFAVTPSAITEYSVTTGASNPQRIAAGPDGNLWFIEYAGNKIGKMTTAGVLTEYKIPTNASNAQGIAAGPDGNMWFAEIDGNKIGKVTPTGTVTEYSLPVASSQPNSIAAGPDGNVWFTEAAPSANKIGMVTPAGTITEHTIPTDGSNPNGIVAGPDGNLWFTEYATNMIGRVTPAGAFTEFAITTLASHPIAITAGPDGNLWFTEAASGVNKIGRVDTSGAFAEFGIPTALSNPQSIAAGPDGNLWFTESAKDKIGKVTPSGTFAEFATAAGSAPNSIVAGSDGHLWFTEWNANKIGRF
jgi:streptogramin lyase